ncbi:AMP-binding protein [Actinocatenispora thailandica]|uniref:AMP-binding protein n=1 Tax=Actinocatenispora thailandica TaxID=227318 RepID=UPI001EF29923|nr:AMP-binding protein [Actinocatenispora thailandica]
MSQDIRNIADLVPRAAQARPDHVALRLGDTELTWSALADRVGAVAAALRARALTAGDRLVIALPNGIEWVVGYFAAMRADLVPVPVNPGYTGAELARLLTDCGARILLGTPAVHDASAGIEVPYRFVVGGTHRLAEPYQQLADAGRDADAPAPGRGGEDVAVLLYTSGTSGRPRAAMLSHRALLANGAQMGRLDPAPVGVDDVVLLALPLFHAFGLGPGLHEVARYGATGVLVPRFDAEATLAEIDRYQVTTVLGVPAMFASWAAHGDLTDPLRSVRLAVSGAAPLPPAPRKALQDNGITLHEGYGLTEAAPVVTSTLAAPTAKPGSVGRPLPGIELRLIGADGEPLTEADSEADENASPGTDPGEVVVRGDNLFSGYWPNGADGPDPDGWWRTGDIGYLDADGDLFLVDRVDELILVSGFNVYPREVEAVLAAHPAVREAAVVGVPHPLTGQAVRGYVVPEPGVAATEEELIAYCHRSLAHFKCPVAVEIVARLPHSATGKVRKAELPHGTTPTG